MIHVKEIFEKQLMLDQLELIQEAYPEFTSEIYDSFLTEMLPLRYGQVHVVEENVCIGLAGFWINTKLWCGKYLELDNVIVSKEHRSKGIGRIITEYLVEKARENDCNMAVLDAYTTNFGAQKFYMNLGFIPKGFHFIKYLKEENTVS